MNTWNYIKKKLKKEKLHFSLLDPDKQKMDIPKLRQVIEHLDTCRTDLILVGGSTNIDTKYVDEFLLTIKEKTDIPAVIFPGSISSISRYADAILFMSLMNSTDPLWISWQQAKAAPLIKEFLLETIAMGYVIIHPGMRAGEVGKAKLIALDDSSAAIQFALASQYFGMKMFYLEAGSGSPCHAPVEMVQAIRKVIDIPIIVGGGIRTPEEARNIMNAGADIIVTGTQIENDIYKTRLLIDAVKA